MQDLVVDEGERELRVEGHQPQRQLAHLHGHRVDVRPVQARGDDGADRVGLQLAWRQSRHSFLALPRLHESVGEVAGGRDEERAGAAGDVGDLEFQYPVRVDRHPSVWLLVGTGIVDEGFQRVPDDVRGEGLGRVVRACGLAGRRLDHQHAAGDHDRGPVAQVAADDPDERPESLAQLRVGRHDRAQRPVSVLDLAAYPDGLGERGPGRRGGRRLALLDPGEDRAGQGVVRPPRAPALRAWRAGSPAPRPLCR